jgi:hypothetical protein
MRLADLAWQVRGIEREFENDPATDRLPFSFTTGATALIHQLGRPLRLLRKHFPNVRVKITVAPAEEMVAGPLGRRFDLALISPFEHDHLAILPRFEGEMLILKPSSTFDPGMARGDHPAGGTGLGAGSYFIRREATYGPLSIDFSAT